MATFIKKFASKLGVLDYKGTWNASNNTPDLAASLPKKGHYYIVSTSGSFDLNGISAWETGDWVVHNGTEWQKIDAADKAKTSQLETSINNLTVSVNNISNDTSAIPTITADIESLQINSDSLKNFNLSEVFYVAKNGNDTLGSGSSANPFLSISGALAKIDSYSVQQDKNVLILVAPGAYAENVTVTRPKTHILGLVSSRSNTVTISGNVTINPSAVVGGLHNSLFTLENLLVAPGSGDAVTITGANECSVCLTNLYCYTSGTGVKRGLVANQTSAVKTRIQINNMLINNVSSNSKGASLTNSHTTAQYLTCYAGASEALELINTTLTASSSWFQNNNPSNLVSVNATSVFSIGNSYAYNQYQNGNGISIAPGGQVVCANNVFQITGTSGFVVVGSLGSVFTHANNSFVYGTSNKISSAIGAGNVPMSTTFVSA